jgi:hypothetical protein
MSLSSKKVLSFKRRSMPFGAPEGQTTIMPTTDFSGWHLRQKGAGPANKQETRYSLTS